MELQVWVEGHWRDVTRVLTPKQRELLVFLAVAGEDGARRTAVTAAIWPGRPAARPYNSLHSTLSLVRRVLERVTDGVIRDVVVRSGSRYRIDGDLVDVDYWCFETAAESAAVNLYRGELGSEISSLWIETAREEIRRNMLRVLNQVVQGDDTDVLPAALAVLETMQLADPYNEQIDRLRIIICGHLGRSAATRRSLH